MVPFSMRKLYIFIAKLKIVHDFNTSINGYSTSITAFAYLTDSLLASGHNDGTVIVWDAKFGVLKNKFDAKNNGHNDSINALVYLNNITLTRYLNSFK